MKSKARRLTLAIYNIDQSYTYNERKRRMSRAELNIMYALDDGLPHSQAELCRDWLVPKTTMNTIIRRWEKEGLAVQVPVRGKRREMTIRLTDKGKEYVRTYMDPIYNVEEKALERTIAKYGDTFIEALEDFSLNIFRAFSEQKDEGNAK